MLFPVLLIALWISRAEAEWALQMFTGTALNFATTLTIEQPDQETLRISADYETRPWESAPYYSVRIGRWQERVAWELELTHHKIYLTNPPPSVQHFAVSNGYGLLMGNHAWENRGFIIRAGAGGVIAYPITTIQGIKTSGGYRLSGFAVQGSLEKRFFWGQKFFVSAEAKLTAAYAAITLENAKAKVPNIALHGLLGAGYKF